MDALQLTRLQSCKVIAFRFILIWFIKPSRARKSQAIYNINWIRSVKLSHSGHRNLKFEQKRLFWNWWHQIISIDRTAYIVQVIWRYIWEKIAEWSRKSAQIVCPEIRFFSSFTIDLSDNAATILKGRQNSNCGWQSSQSETICQFSLVVILAIVAILHTFQYGCGIIGKAY